MARPQLSRPLHHEPIWTRRGDDKMLKKTEGKLPGAEWITAAMPWYVLLTGNEQLDKLDSEEKKSAAVSKVKMCTEGGCRAEKPLSLLSLEHMSAVQNMVDGAQDRNEVHLTPVKWEFNGI